MKAILYFTRIVLLVVLVSLLVPGDVGARQVPATPSTTDIAALKDVGEVRAAWSHLTPEQMASVWQKKVGRCLREMAFTPLERRAVDSGLALLIEENYVPLDVEPRNARDGRLRAAWNRIQMVLGAAKMQEVFVRLPKAEIAARGRQSNPPPDEVKRLQERTAAIEAFNKLTPGQRAAVMRRYIQGCLDRLTLTAEQRAVVSEILSTLITPASYTTRTPDEERAFRARTQPLYDRAEQVLGRQLNLEIFFRGMTLENIEAVKRDSTIK